jgi:hypothetical protein
MNFNLSEEQTLIRDSIARFVADNYGFDKRNDYVASEHGFSNENCHCPLPKSTAALVATRLIP